jgi:hypothetical protein
MSADIWNFGTLVHNSISLTTEEVGWVMDAQRMQYITRVAAPDTLEPPESRKEKNLALLLHLIFPD